MLPLMRTLNFTWFPLGLACMLLAMQPAAAWNRNGHAAIAAIAEANLTPVAQAQVKQLLQDDLNARNRPSGRTTLAEVASWPDEIRSLDQEKKYRGWHTRGNPVCASKLGICWMGRCVDRNLLRYAAVLKDRHADRRERNEALKWVVHLVGDLHTPLHSGSNRDAAGNVPATLTTTMPPRESTLHSLWDVELVNAALKQGPVTASLNTAGKLPPTAIRQWMQETREISLTHVYGPLPGFSCNGDFAGPYLLDHAYQQQAVPVIREQIRRAGLRLAQLLNELLD
ncbi:MAG: hypothetical protein H6R04_1643 [Burkholderiaceae bacterium]|nr:hypothetical protein [Burkholderiaceae bacterium]